eukprot:6421298-Alexandrium_andersonii.AAC.1
MSLLAPGHEHGRSQLGGGRLQASRAAAVAASLGQHRAAYLEFQRVCRGWVWLVSPSPGRVHCPSDAARSCHSRIATPSLLSVANQVRRRPWHRRIGRAP